mgnify:CR=1 FL=1
MIPYRFYSLPVTVAAGSATSSAIRIHGQVAFGVSVPASVDGERLGFEVREDATQPFRLFHDASGVVTVPLVANAYVALPQEQMRSLASFADIRLVTLDASGNPVNQTSDATFRIYTATI